MMGRRAEMQARSVQGMRKQAIDGSSWLRHLKQDDQRQPWDITMEVHQQRLEEQLLGIANRITDHHGAQTSEAMGHAVNLLTNEMLKLQREHAPSGQVSMVSSLAMFDPALEGMRASVFALVRRARRRGYWTGVASVLAMLGGALLAHKYPGLLPF